MMECCGEARRLRFGVSVHFALRYRLSEALAIRDFSMLSNVAKVCGRGSHQGSEPQS